MTDREDIDPMTAQAAPPTRAQQLVAEAFGVFTLVFVGVGAALFAADSALADALGAPAVSWLAIAVSFGLALAAATATWGPVSGGHFNPAVTVGLAVVGRFAWKSVPAYLIAQLIGGAIASTMLVLLGLFGPEGWLARAQDAGFGSNGFGAHSPGGFSLGGAIIAEALFTGLFMLVFLGTCTRRSTAAAVRGAAVTMTLLALMPITFGSLNPARSFATALYGGPEALVQLWVFLLAPTLGAALAAAAHRALFGGVTPEPRIEPETPRA